MEFTAIMVPLMHTGDGTIRAVVLAFLKTALLGLAAVSSGVVFAEPSDDSEESAASNLKSEDEAAPETTIESWLSDWLEKEREAEGVADTSSLPEEAAEPTYRLQSLSTDRDDRLPEKQQQELWRSLCSQTRELKQDISSIQQWESEDAPPSGRVDTLFRRARNFSLERKNRRALQAQLRDVSKTAKAWLQSRRASIAETTRRLEEILERIRKEPEEADVESTLRKWGKALAERVRESKEVPAGWERSPSDLAETAPQPQAKGDLHDSLLAVLQTIQTEIDSIEQWEEGLTLSSNGGHAEDLVYKAAAFPRERKNRKRLQEIAGELFAACAQWEQREQSRGLRTLQRIDHAIGLLASSPKPSSEDDADVETREIMNQERFEYYELQEARTVAEVSALPAVYGDPARWEDLMSANRRLVSKKDKNLPKGTVLIVPRRPLSAESSGSRDEE